MTPTLESLGIDKLNARDRMEIAHAIWDSLATETEAAPLTESQKAEVDRRLAAHRANPTAAIPWDEIKAEALARLQKVNPTIRFLPEAREEFDRAIAWYEERGVELAKDFVARIDAVVQRVAANPKMHALAYRDVRKAVVSRFPYLVLYREDDGELLVVGVFHTARDPDEWKSRLG